MVRTRPAVALAPIDCSSWRAASVLVSLVLLWGAAPSAASTKVDYGPISHKGLKKLGAASTSKMLTLQLGLIANQSGLQSAVKSASNPTSNSYGKYPSLSTLQSKYGASSSKRKGVVNAFKKQNVTAKVDVTHLRVSATVSIGKAKKMFGTKWAVYKAKSGAHVALPVNTPKLPSGIKGNVDTVAGTRLQLTNGSSSATTSAVDGGTPTRTGTPAPGCTSTTFPSALASGNGLFPNQILTAYGIAPLQVAGLQGQGVRLAIVGEAPTPASDVNAFRSCFGTTGTSLKIHNAGSIKPIIESSLDAMVSSMVAPKLANFDLWVHSLSEEDDDGDAEGFLQLLAQPLQATTNGAKLPHVISVSYGTCESAVAPYTASVTLVERQLTATAALGITTVVASTGPWNDTVYPPPFAKTAGGGGGQSTFEKRPWWQPAQSFASSKYRMVPDVAAFADESPGYPIVCSKGVQGCSGSGQTIAFVGGTSAAAPLVAGMVALWNQQAKNQGLPKPGFVPPLLYATAKRNPEAFLDVTVGTNALFGGSCCPARPGYDLATGWGSPMANTVAGLLGARG